MTKGWSRYYASRIADDEEKDGKVMAFARDLVKATWKFTSSVWGSHNEKIHGRKTKYSSRDVTSIQKCIVEIYDQFKTFVSQEDQWLFREEVRIRCKKPVPQMIGWLERVLLSLEETPEAENTRKIAKRLLCKISIYSIFD